MRRIRHRAALRWMATGRGWRASSRQEWREIPGGSGTGRAGPLLADGGQPAERSPCRLTCARS
jgi:hypothetical protein